MKIQIHWDRGCVISSCQITEFGRMELRAAASSIPEDSCCTKVVFFFPAKEGILWIWISSVRQTSPKNHHVYPWNWVAADRDTKSRNQPDYEAVSVEFGKGIQNSAMNLMWIARGFCLWLGLHSDVGIKTWHSCKHLWLPKHDHFTQPIRIMERFTPCMTTRSMMFHQAQPFGSPRSVSTIFNHRIDPQPSLNINYDQRLTIINHH